MSDGEHEDAAFALALSLEPWRVVLRDGQEIVIWAHSYHETEGAFVFNIMVEGKPLAEVEAARIPKAIVEGVWSA